MTLDEHRNLSETDKAFLKLGGRCTGCGCDLNGTFKVHSEWCEKSPAFIWHPPKEKSTVITHSRRQGKSVFADMVNQLNKLFGKQK